MKVQELKNFTVDELNARINQWKEELFRSRFKAQSSEVRDTSVFRKLRRDVARAKTILNQKLKAPQDQVSQKAKAK